MTRFKVTFVLYLCATSAIALKCPDGIQAGTCSPNETTHEYTSRSINKPKALSMVAEDIYHDSEHVFQPTPLPLTITDSSSVTAISPASHTSTEPKGRAINFGISDPNNENHLTGNFSSKQNADDLSNVSMESDDQEEIVPKILTSKTIENSTRIGTFCTKGGLTYENGEKLENECESVCTCNNGKMDCTARCLMPYVRKGRALNDTLCIEKATDDACCSILVCSDTEGIKPVNKCTFKNKTYHEHEQFEDNCESRCTCELGGSVSCVPRCPKVKKTSERCVEVPDPIDKCCKTILCDVTLDDHEPEKEDESNKPKLLTARFLNSTTIKLEFDSNLNNSHNMPVIEVSENKKDWTALTIVPGGYLESFGNSIKYLKMNNSNDIIEIHMLSSKDHKPTCNYKGRQLKMGEEYNDNCTSLCFCRQNGIQCLPLDCPTYFGVDVLNPNCIEWETEPVNFVPTPPVCCPKSIKCKNTGSCMYKDVLYNNWQQIPLNVTGCEQRCFCEMGNVECQNICPPVTAMPPANLECPPNRAKIGHLPEDDCCVYWTCKDDGDSTGMHPQMYPGGFLNIPGHGYQSHDEITVHTLEAIDAHTIRLAFTVPPVIVGLHGRVEVRYTYNDNNDLNTWQLQVFAPPNDLIETAQLEFDLLGLKEDTEYKIKITITLRDLHNTPSSRIYTVRTLRDVAATTLPPNMPIEPNLVVTDINATWVTVAWRKFTDSELQFIDGVQVRYREIDGKIYAATPLIHRAVTSYTLENLKSNTKYEAGIFFIPFAGQTTELHADNMIHFTTSNEIDSYGFNVTLEIGHVKSTSAEITWSGVPYPEDKYVNIYRAIYQSDSGKGDFSTFKLAKRDSPPKATIMDLKPGIRYRLWLEVYLTNGRIKTSNVQDFITRPRTTPAALGASLLQSKLEADNFSERRGDYYGPLVIVAILAAIAILSTLILLLILVKRHNQNKAAITTPASRVSQSAYDNPTYKVEIQQETMDL